MLALAQAKMITQNGLPTMLCQRKTSPTMIRSGRLKNVEKSRDFKYQYSQSGFMLTGPLLTNRWGVLRRPNVETFLAS